MRCLNSNFRETVLLLILILFKMAKWRIVAKNVIRVDSSAQIIWNLWSYSNRRFSCCYQFRRRRLNASDSGFYYDILVPRGVGELHGFPLFWVLYTRVCISNHLFPRMRRRELRRTPPISLKSSSEMLGEIYGTRDSVGIHGFFLSGFWYNDI